MSVMSPELRARCKEAPQPWQVDADEAFDQWALTSIEVGLRHGVAPSEVVTFEHATQLHGEMGLTEHLTLNSLARQVCPNIEVLREPPTPAL